MNTSTPKEVVAGIVRHLATAAGGYLAGSGYIAESDVTMLAGAAATLAGIAWSIFQKVSKNAKTVPAQ